MMMISSLKQNFLTNPLIIPNHNLKPISKNPFFIVSCRNPQNENQPESSTSRKIEKQLAKLALVTLATGVLTLSSMGDASAAKSGGRVGGQAFRSSAPPRASAPRANSRTNIYINPRVAPPLVGGYGFGYGVPFYGGWGWSPFSFAGPGVGVGVGGGFDLFLLFIVLGAVSAVIRRFRRSRDDDDDDY